MLGLTPLKEGVVDRHDRWEVLVDRRRLYSQAPGDFRQSEAVHPLLGHDVDRNVEDLLDGLLAAPSPAVEPLRLTGVCGCAQRFHPRKV